MNLFALSDANAASLESQLKSADSPLNAEVLHEFMEHVSTYGRVAVNMKLWHTADFLTTGTYLNMYEAVEEENSFTGRPVEELMAKRLGTYRRRRECFDSAFEESKSFRYGALNTGGTGAAKYGPFCVVLKPTFPGREDQVAYVKNDTLNHYTGVDGTLDHESLQQDLASQSHRHHLAAIKHNANLTSEKGRWPEMLCSDSGYVEVIFVADVDASTVGEVRVTAEQYQSLFDLFYKSAGNKLSDGEDALVHNFRQILRWCRRAGITLEEVHDA